MTDALLLFVALSAVLTRRKNCYNDSTLVEVAPNGTFKRGFSYGWKPMLTIFTQNNNSFAEDLEYAMFQYVVEGNDEHILKLVNNNDDIEPLCALRNMKSISPDDVVQVQPTPQTTTTQEDDVDAKAVEPAPAEP